jgi:hypothetical protein
MIHWREQIAIIKTSIHICSSVLMEHVWRKIRYSERCLKLLYSSSSVGLCNVPYSLRSELKLICWINHIFYLLNTLITSLLIMSSLNLTSFQLRHAWTDDCYELRLFTWFRLDNILTSSLVMSSLLVDACLPVCYLFIQLKSGSSWGPVVRSTEPGNETPDSI